MNGNRRSIEQINRMPNLFHNNDETHHNATLQSDSRSMPSADSSRFPPLQNEESEPMDQQPPISIPFVAQRWQEENTNKATLTKNPSTSSSSFLSLKQQRHSRQRLTLRRWMNILPIRFFSFCIVIFCIPSGMFLEPHGERLSHEERRSMRNLFLKRFGLEPLADVISKGDVIRPHRRQPRSILSETNLPLPKYIWDIYEKHASGELPYETIRHFLPVSLQTIQENRLLLTYNLTAMGRNPEGEIVLKADLRLPIGEHWKVYRNTMGSIESLVDDPRMLIKSRMNSANSEENEENQNVDKNWVIVNVVHAIREADEPSAAGVIQLVVKHSGVNSTLIDSLRHSAALIIYSNSRNYEHRIFPELDKADYSGRRGKRRIEPDEESASPKSRPHRRRKYRRLHHAKDGGRQCRRNDLYVDFGQLNWQEWIMAPIGYEAYQCSGRCSHPMPSHMNTTNHAIVQLLLHSLDPSAVSPPSCVPIQMSAISILYRDPNNVVAVKSYADMKVDSCGCH